MSRNGRHLFTSESVTEGHPDKVCDTIADSILDAYLTLDKRSRVACEVLAKSGVVVLAGEITSVDTLDHVKITRETIAQIGYTDKAEAFNAETVNILQHLTGQAWEIGRGVDPSTSQGGEQGAGDQGIMFGYATDETEERLPLPILLAHRLAAGLAEDRRGGSFPWLRPDGKTQVSVVYEDDKPIRVSDVLVSTQHAKDASPETIRAYVEGTLAPRILGKWKDDRTRVLVNPTGSFSEGGPSADCGVTGRKIIVDSYGGMGRHGGGAFSGKDPSKVDRSAAYAARWVAKNVVAAGLAERVEVELAYGIGIARPISLSVESFGTGRIEDAAIQRLIEQHFDLRPAAIIAALDLRRPIYRQTAAYGHFGRPDLDLPWERTNMAALLASEAGVTLPEPVPAG
jgi:S-adenosylmethionine synthetase